MRALTPSSSIDGTALREALTGAARAHEGAETALRAAALAALKDARDAGLARVRADLDGGAGGLETARALARLADDLVCALYDFVVAHVYRVSNPTEGERLAVCAVGGYGRGERAPGSDIDLLFLRSYKPTPWDESVIEYMLQMLWDLGFKVGSAARSIDQCVRLARKDWTVLTSLLDLRRLAGDAAFPGELAARVADEVLNGRARDFVAAKLAERDKRLARQGSSRYMVEPDVKQAKGGLRDLQTLDWLARGVSAARGDSAPAALLFATEEARRSEAAADFLWRVRGFMHFAAGRAQDKLTFDLQPEIARCMGFEDDGAEPAVERFMRQYFLVAKEVGTLTRILCAKLEAGEAKGAPRGLMRFWRRSTKRKELDEPGVVSEAGRIAFEDPSLPEREPAAMLRLFRAAARRGEDVHPDALAVVDRAAERIDDTFRADAAAAEMFFEILLDARSVEGALRLMNESGLLGAYLPEFGRIIGRTQFNMYHCYTVDEHTLRVVGGLADLERGKLADDKFFAARLFERLDNRRALYLAALMHDVGKGLGDQEAEGEKLARAAAVRLGLPPGEVELVCWLVGRHLLLSDVAQRRDLGDTRTVADFVAEVGAPERLRLLSLLTIADINAVGPGVWTAWKRHLIHNLFELSQAVFRGGRATAERVNQALNDHAGAARDQLVEASGDDTRAFSVEMITRLEDAYWIAFDDAAHARHRDFLYSASLRGRTADVDARWLADTETAELLVVAQDAPGLFARLTAALARVGADVRGARLYTASDGGVFDVFTLSFSYAGAGDRDLGEGDWGVLERVSEETLAAARGVDGDGGGLPPAAPVPSRERAFQVEPSVSIDNRAAAEATIVEVSGRDRAGLLAALAQVFADFGVSVQSAHVENYGERAMDVFYVAEASGGAIEHAARRAALRRKLLTVLEDPQTEAPKLGARTLARARASGPR